MSGWMRTTVTRELTVHLTAPGDACIALPVVLRYDLGDPYAVHATFHTGQDEGVSWVFARELLSQGVRQPAGDGDVRVWPSWGVAGEMIFISLTSPDGEALLQAPVRDVVDFLARTNGVCAQGRERDHLDLDGAIEALLAAT